MRSRASAVDLRAELVDHARRLVARDGARALTMRSLAAEAGCAVGLPYKVFADRNEIVVEILRAELGQLVGAGQDLVARAGYGRVGENVAEYAEAILDSPAVALSSEVVGDRHLAGRFTRDVEEAGAGPGHFEATLAEYLEAEQHEGRVAHDVAVGAMAFLVAGAVHNLVVSGPAYPRPSRVALRHHIDALADLIAPR